MTDRLPLVARKDLGDSIRNYQFYYVGALFLVIALGIGYLAGSAPDGTADYVRVLGLAYLFLAPVTVLSLSHDAVTGKRASGELTVLLGLPVSRSDVVYGSVLGRTVVVGTAAVGSAVLSVVLAVAMGVSPAVGAFVLTLAGVLLMTLTFASLAVACSAVSGSTTLSSTGAFGVFVLFVFQLWVVIPDVVNAGLDRLGAGSIPDGAADAWANLSPYAAVRNLAVGLAGSAGEPLGAYAPGYTASNTPLSQSPVVGALVLAFWIAVPVTLAYRRFATADL